MRRHLPNDCAACTDLRVRVGELEQRVVALEQPRPREAVPVWTHLPRGRRVRTDAAHLPRAPHPLLIAVFVSARGGAAYRRGAEEGTARPLVLNRVA